MIDKHDRDFRPRFVGDDFSDFRHPSLFGAFCMVVRLNHLRPQDYMAAFGLRVRREDDLSRILTFSKSRMESVRRALGLTLTAGELEPWLPFRCDVRLFEQKWIFRYCLSCLRVGYHTLLHQLPWISRCPWHGDQLRTDCRRCGRRMTIDGTSGRRLLQCECGFEVLNESCAVAGDRQLVAQSEPYLESYLTWASGRRSRWRLFSPQSIATNVSVLRELVRLPAALAFRSQDPVGLCRNHFGSLSEAQAPFGVDDLKSAVAKMSTLAEDDINMVEVPKHLERSFIRVGCDLANHLPHGALSSTEMTLFFDGAVRQSSGIFKPAQRKSIQDISWLPTRLVGNRRFLSLSCIDPKATRVAAELV